MKYIIIPVFILSCNICIAQSVTKYVNPFIGTAGHGHTYPGATVPFGLVQLSPDTDYNGWDWCSGYNYGDSTIIGFSHTHLSGTGVGDLTDLIIMPTVGAVQFFPGPTAHPEKGYRSKFSHSTEKASPGYYSVHLQDHGIQAELTTTTHVGMHRYTFPATNEANIIIDPTQAIPDGQVWNTGDLIDTELNILNDSTVEGYKHSTGWAPEQHVYFVIRFSKPFSDYGFIDWNPSLINKYRYKNEKQTTKLYVRFTTKAQEKITVKVGLSSVSKKGALENLNSQVPHWDFDKIKEKANLDWEKELSKIKIEAPEETKTIYYTALYHTAIAPNVLSDVDGTYKDIHNHRSKQSSGKAYYSTFSLWDTYRAANPLYTITNPNRVADFINTFLDFYDDKGFLPMWPLWGNETYCMIGNHAIPVIVDAYVKGIKGFDAERAYKAIYSTSTKTHFKSEIDMYSKYGYFPSDLIHADAVSKTLEHGYNDWCVSKMATAMGKTNDAAYFAKRAQGYKLLFDPVTGFMRGKLANGAWDDTQPFKSFKFDPRFYTEATAWQYLWYVPHDVQGLVKIMGGPAAFSRKLDTLFKVSSKFEGERGDITGLIGQYAHGNEPSHHIAYLFNYVQNPSLTQFYVDKILRTQYNTSPAGLCGNEDCGQMSAWYVLSAIGLYAVNPASGIYDITAPHVSAATIALENGKEFKIVTRNFSDKNIYIQSIKLNDKPYSAWTLAHSEIVKGGVLEITLGPKPGK